MNRRGFTLIELMVAMGILLVLSALTLTMVNVTMNADRIRSASRDVQAYLEGARNQAIYSKQVRGVRFLLSPEDNTTVNSMLYIGTPNHFDNGSVTVSQGSDAISAAPAVAQAWVDFRQRGMLINGARIKIPKNGGDWYTIAQDGTDNWRLTKPYSRPTSGPENYSVELAPAILPYQEPKTLSQRVAIDLDVSKIPGNWISSAGPPTTYIEHLDILFGPRGEVYRGTGKVHLVLSDTSDTAVNCPLPSSMATWAGGTIYAPGQWVTPTGTTEFQFLCTAAGTSGVTEPPEFATAKVGTAVSDGTATWLCHSRKPSIVLSLTTSTGNAASYPMGEADPFVYAETGHVAN